MLLKASQNRTIAKPPSKLRTSDMKHDLFESAYRLLTKSRTTFYLTLLIVEKKQNSLPKVKVIKKYNLKTHLHIRISFFNPISHPQPTKLSNPLPTFPTTPPPVHRR